MHLDIPIDIKYAEKSDKPGVIYFFQKNISEGNDSIISNEFLCPFGISGAIDRHQVIIIALNGEIIGGMRFYPRKKDNTVSMYQFAIDERYRSRGLVMEMLKFSGYHLFEGICFIESGFNDYYQKEGWINSKSDGRYNYWHYEMLGR